MRSGIDLIEATRVLGSPERCAQAFRKPSISCKPALPGGLRIPDNSLKSVSIAIATALAVQPSNDWASAMAKLLSASKLSNTASMSRSISVAMKPSVVVVAPLYAAGHATPIPSPDFCLEARAVHTSEVFQ
jgi:hypothetical protein